MHVLLRLIAAIVFNFLTVCSLFCDKVNQIANTNSHIYFCKLQESIKDNYWTDSSCFEIAQRTTVSFHMQQMTTNGSGQAGIQQLNMLSWKLVLLLTKIKNKSGM